MHKENENHHHSDPHTALTKPSLRFSPYLVLGDMSLLREEKQKKTCNFIIFDFFAEKNDIKISLKHPLSIYLIFRFLLLAAMRLSCIYFL